MDNQSALANDQTRVLADYVLIKQTMKKKKSRILMDAAHDQKDKFDLSFEIVQVGNKCERDINVGDHPIFSEYVKFSGVKVLEKDEEGMVSLVIVHEGDIIAVDNTPPPTQETQTENSVNQN